MSEETNMIHNITRNSTYNYSITYEKPQSKLKDWGGTKALVEKNDADKLIEKMKMSLSATHVDFSVYIIFIKRDLKNAEW